MGDEFTKSLGINEEKGKFKIEGVPGEFEGFADPRELWNGWATPRFTKEQGLKIIEAWPVREFGYGEASFNEMTQSFDFYDPANDETDHFPADLDGLFPIGTCCWIWEAVPDEPEFDPPAEPPAYKGQSWMLDSAKVVRVFAIMEDRMDNGQDAPGDALYAAYRVVFPGGKLDDEEQSIVEALRCILYSAVSAGRAMVHCL